MKRTHFPQLLFAALAALVLTAGCDTAPKYSPRTTKTCILSPDHPSPDLEVTVVTAVRIVLPGPAPGSGLVWEIISNNNRVLDQMGPFKTLPASDELGSRPASTISFYAKREGKSELRFFLLKPGQEEAVPVAKCDLIVRVTD